MAETKASGSREWEAAAGRPAVPSKKVIRTPEDRKKLAETVDALKVEWRKQFPEKELRVSSRALSLLHR